MSATVAVLYVETGGVYYNLPDVDPWDEQRDARLYAGPWPVVAHPPCDRWCRFAPGIQTRFGYKVGDDAGRFEAALEAVRRFGGVLEHPAYSLAWPAFNLPRPISSVGWSRSLLDDPGASCYIEQGQYGHDMKKATWLYAVLPEYPQLRWRQRRDGELERYRWSKVRYAGDEGRERRSANSSRTPPEFRDVLLAMARSARPLAAVLVGEEEQ